MTSASPFADNHLADISAQADEMASALRTLKPKVQHRRTQLFSLLYPVIVELLENSITQKSILEMLEEKGLKLHPSRFKELMAAEAEKRRAQSHVVDEEEVA
ncbi:hypothetical protein [Coralloluteibacterium stylophorae]|uniref:Uncharacterized protein n=1 Tax=Coralloluteibacterium stylophorae TaxID=1776034 RepID=A0A8J7VV33_9GAMM|nr:hypothetical protein [Coralloluteibacterium stylophorae]MBS7459044.1 hypothetical protein [Coralloluteibacterium stylophorae]